MHLVYNLSTYYGCNDRGKLCSILKLAIAPFLIFDIMEGYEQKIKYMNLKKLAETPGNQIVIMKPFTFFSKLSVYHTIPKWVSHQLKLNFSTLHDRLEHTCGTEAK